MPLGSGLVSSQLDTRVRIQRVQEINITIHVPGGSILGGSMVWTERITLEIVYGYRIYHEPGVHEKVISCIGRQSV